MKYYTIFLGKKLWRNVIDDMNSSKDFSWGGLLWTSKKLAENCIKNLQHPAYGFETKNKKFSVIELNPKNNSDEKTN